MEPFTLLTVCLSFAQPSETAWRPALTVQPCELGTWCDPKHRFETINDLLSIFESSSSSAGAIVTS